jgi:hypothetical protein
LVVLKIISFAYYSDSVLRLSSFCIFNIKHPDQVELIDLTVSSEEDKGTEVPEIVEVHPYMQYCNNIYAVYGALI